MTCDMLPYADTEGVCDGCGRKLRGRQKRWCSRKCARLYTANHRWTQAKAFAKAGRTYYLCEHAKLVKGVPYIDTKFHDICAVWTNSPEVNHKIPCKGKHGKWGCHHHQDNLEVLCRPCHLQVTAQQRKEGLL